jgi:aspartate beta-hydroxylase
MTPGTHIKPHRGTTNLRVLCHLALRIPRGDCAIRVGGEARPWREGRCIVFDDYYEHEAWNFTAEDRIVLMLDLWHPDLTGPEIAVLEGLERHAVVRALDLRLAEAAPR